MRTKKKNGGIHIAKNIQLREEEIPARPYSSDVDDDEFYLGSSKQRRLGRRPSLNLFRSAMKFPSIELFSIITRRKQQKNLKQKDGHPQQPKYEPHPLRTDTWQLKVRWRPPDRRRQGQRNENHYVETDSFSPQDSIIFEFAPNGYVRAVVASDQDDHDTHSNDSATSHCHQQHKEALSTSWIGTWKSTGASVTWVLPMGPAGNEYFFSADLHVNPFGLHPRMSRGIVILWNSSDYNTKRKWFRPVIATFRGMGIGKDTADFSYSHRQLVCIKWSQDARLSSSLAN